MQLTGDDVVKSIQLKGNDGDQISKELREKVFEPFFKVDETTQGTGLGLPFVRSLAELHEGNVTIADNPHGLTQFVLELPINHQGSFNIGVDAEIVPQPVAEEPTAEIAPENIAKELKDTSVVMTKFDIGDGMQGMIGVVGPTRMDYAKVTARLSYFAESLSKMFAKPEQAQLPEADCSTAAATVSGYKTLCIYVKCGYYFLAHIATSFVDFLSNLQQI